MTITFEMRKSSDEELALYKLHQVNNIKDAETLFNAAKHFEGSLRINGMDGSDILLALAAGLLEGCTERFSGVSQTGIFATIKRISGLLKEVNPNWYMTRYTKLNHFGFRGRSVFTPVTVGDHKVVFKPTELFKESFENEFVAAFITSPHCRVEEGQQILSMLRGLVALERMSQYEPTPNEVTNNIRPTKGKDYAHELAKAFMLSPENLESALINDMERASVWELPPIVVDRDAIESAAQKAKGRDPFTILSNAVRHIYDKTMNINSEDYEGATAY